VKVRWIVEPFRDQPGSDFNCALTSLVENAGMIFFGRVE